MATNNNLSAFFQNLRNETTSVSKEIIDTLKFVDYKDFSLIDANDDDVDVRIFFSVEKEERSKDLSRIFSSLLDEITKSTNLRLLIAAKLLAETSFLSLKERSVEKEMALAQMFLVNAFKTLQKDIQGGDISDLNEESENSEEDLDEDLDTDIDVEEDGDEGGEEIDYMRTIVKDIAKKLQEECNITININENFIADCDGHPIKIPLADFEKIKDRLHNVDISVGNNTINLSIDGLNQFFENVFPEDVDQIKDESEKTSDIDEEDSSIRDYDE